MTKIPHECPVESLTWILCSINQYWLQMRIGNRLILISSNIITQNVQVEDTDNNLLETYFELSRIDEITCMSFVCVLQRVPREVTASRADRSVCVWTVPNVTQWMADVIAQLDGVDSTVPRVSRRYSHLQSTNYIVFIRLQWPPLTRASSLRTDSTLFLVDRFPHFV